MGDLKSLFETVRTLNTPLYTLVIRCDKVSDGLETWGTADKEVAVQNFGNKKNNNFARHKLALFPI